MERIPLGDSGLEVSRIGLGCNNFGGRIGRDATAAVVDAALEAGVDFFDTADIYGDKGGSETLLGELLGARRDRVVLATKFGKPMGDEERRGSAAYVRRACEASLRRLRTDRIDLYYMHEPDPATPIAETLGALDELHREGKVLAIGCSNFDAAQLREADAAAREAGTIRFTAIQNEYSLLEREPEREVLPAARELGVGFVPFFPLASGLLTGKYRRGEAAPEGTRLASRPEALTDEAFDRLEALERFAAERGHGLLELALAWLASQPGIAGVIAGATKPEQVRANAAAAADWHLSADDMSALATAGV